ncbi:putative ribosomal N-acetyltransferase YdaF [invertebrate metagenome]|uniref:Putative ribosomal N-acetyltransferase YdaF n=1 Tax=invertebrate metagenome TaxID=1711999 RepID=A0A2H9TB20_9ZZZZ
MLQGLIMRFDLGNGYCIRSFMYGDAPLIADHGNNRKVSRNLRDSFPHPYTIDHARAWVQHVKQHEAYSRFIIAYEDKAVGEIGFVFQGDVHRYSAEIGYWLSEEHWGKGIMSRAIPEICEYAFREFGLMRLYAEVVEHNVGSCRVLEKSGFVLEGRCRKHIYKEDEHFDQLVFGLVKS